MKRAAAFFSFLACSGFLLADSPDPGRALRKPAPLLEDLARLTKAGFSNETVLDYAKAHRAEAPSLIEANDLLRLRESGVGESVVRYMTAIDVRASDQGGGEDIAYESAGAAGYPSAAYSYRDDSDYGYPDNGSYYGYPDTYSYGAYPETYYADYYPFFGAGYYPYPVYFFANNAGFFGRFHGRSHRFGRHRDRFNDHGRFGHPRLPRGGFDRGTAGRRGDVMVAHRGPASPGFPRRSFGPGFVGPRGGVPGRSGIGRPVITRGGSGHGFRAPQAVASRGALARPGFAGGSRAGGGFSRGPTPSSGGGPRPVGRPGGRGGR
jgi:hypothetical protein